MEIAEWTGYVIATWYEGQGAETSSGPYGRYLQCALGNMLLPMCPHQQICSIC